MRHLDKDLSKGVAAGLVAGLAATWVMTQFQNLSAKLEEAAQRDEPSGKAKKAKKEKKEEGDDATVKTASAISEKVFHHELTRREKKVAGPLVHYAFGTLTGGLYGALAELQPAVEGGAGLPFGTALWLAADEVAVPAFGLGDSPLETPPSVHVKALAAHLVYGLVTETLRRQVRRAL